jgi:YVTN family beta-propeller protein
MAADAVAAKTGSAQFGILGPLEVWRSGHTVPLGGPRQRAVLALLLLEANRIVSMDRLAEDVWGGHPPEGWATTVQTYVFHLRHALEPDRARGATGAVLVTKGRGYLLRVDRGHLDAAAFEDGFAAGRAALEAGRYAEAAGTLRQALGLWRGPVLADLDGYAFTRPEAARLDELRLAALEARIDADLALGRHDALTAELEQLAGEHPLRERLHGQLMLALYRCGRQADALAAYRRVRDLLAGELGIDPGEPLQRLHASVLAHDPALDWHPASHAPADGQRPGAGAPTASPAPQPSGMRPVTGDREPAWVRRRGRRLLTIGSALAVAAAACIVAVARPWAGEPAGRLPANSVGLIGPSGGRVGAPVAVGSPEGLAYGDGSVWAADSTNGTVSRIDPATHAVIQSVPVGSAPSAVAVTGQDVWVTNSGDGTVSRISAAANKVVDTITVGNVPVAIASGPSGVWVASQGDGTVSRISPVTGKVTTKVQVGARPDGIAVGPRAVWVANGQDGTVTRIDPATGQPDGPVPVGSGPKGIAVTPAAVWVANSLDLTVSRLDPATGRVTATVGVGDGPTAIVAAENAVWVSNEFDATLNRINPHTSRVVRTVPLGSSPRGMVMSASGVWVAVRPFAAASHRGGTLTVVGTPLPVVDPVWAYLIPDIAALATVYDGFVALRRSAGAAGLTLVPDLARTLPRPTGGGTAYTFTLRRGIRYSNGALVRASDFRRGIQRQLHQFGANPGYYEGILGGRACFRHPRRCDLSAGIVTNDAAGTVTFHLTRADPDFLYKLALLLVTPAPPGAPQHLITGAPFLPGTGPYMISQYQPGTPVTVVRNPYSRQPCAAPACRPGRATYRPTASLTLERNPYFRQWSYAAQPAGYPDAIRFVQMTDPGKQEAAVIAGRADLVDLFFNGQSYPDLATRYPTRVHAGLKLFTTYLFLNTRQPPFADIKARQAVNYAVDRARMLSLLHRGAGQAAVTCQILPADFPGYRPYCPYTAGAKDGAWHGPDLGKARRLVKESGTTNEPVTVWTIRSLADRAVGSYLVQMLNDIGYRASLRRVSFDRFVLASTDPRNKVQIGLFAWGADFPAAGAFFLPVLSCRSFHEAPSGPGNLAEYCDPRADKLASRAQAAQLPNAATARRLWAQVDRLVTDQAPWVPILNESLAGFVSARVGNYQEAPAYAYLLDQMWVR